MQGLIKSSKQRRHSGLFSEIQPVCFRFVKAGTGVELPQRCDLPLLWPDTRRATTERQNRTCWNWFIHLYITLVNGNQQNFCLFSSGGRNTKECFFWYLDNLISLILPRKIGSSAVIEFLLMFWEGWWQKYLLQRWKTGSLVWLFTINISFDCFWETQPEISASVFFVCLFFLPTSFFN